MDSDPITDSPVKRQKTQTGYRPVRAYDYSDDELHQNTIPTQPLHQTIPTQPLSKGGPASDFTFASIMSTINPPASSGPRGLSPYVTQPTQPLRTGSSTPTVQVERSSPPLIPSSPMPAKPVPNIQLKRPGMGSRLAPAGTFYRPPQGTQVRPKPITVDSDDDDPPVHHSDSDLESQPMRSTIRPTEFTRGGKSLHSLPDSGFKSVVSQFAYDSSKPQQRNTNTGDMAGAYGGVSRNRQTGPARAQPVLADLTLDDIPDFAVREKVRRMRSIHPTKDIRELEAALVKNKGVFDHAVSYIFEEEERNHNVVDLTSSDIESNTTKPGAKPTGAPFKPAAKQQVKAPARTIQEKYSSTQAKAKPIEEQPVKRKRLVQGRKTVTSPSPAPEDAAATVVVKKKAVTVIDSDSDMDSGMIPSDNEEEEEEQHSDFDGRLLKFFNTCSVQDLADLSNEKQNIAELILSRRPFRNLAAIQVVSDVQPTKTGRKSTKKPIGEKIFNVCEEMFRGYEAVDGLVDKCDAIGKPITEAMKQWGVDVAAASKEGELALTRLEDAHDSGIGTPSSSTSMLDDDDVKSHKPAKSGKKHAFLKQPANMNTELTTKDYQLFGLNWLNLLWSKKLSCILADDMGLGKTCQVIAFLAHLKEAGVEGTHLVVVPGSTLENWIRELNRFCPALDVAPYYGSQAERGEQRDDYGSRLDEIDVIVTTYETAVGKYDVEFLRKTVRPTVCVFDEGHSLKNHQSKRHQQLMRIPAKFRLLLTGTPLQNNLQELVSLLAFILPEIFNDTQREDLDNIFKYKASTKDADHAALLSAQRIKRARSMMTPFILRRKKQQVLRHMPAKHRRVEYCDMLPAQKEFYGTMVSEALEARAQTSKSKGSARSAQDMTRLRFAALHPLLLRNIYDDKKLKKLATKLQSSHEFSDNRPDQIWKYISEDIKGGDFGLHRFCLERADYLPLSYTLQNEEWMNSGKVTKLRSLLETYLANGDRVLIFSQFTTMMDILEAVFETLAIKFMRLDGSTPMATRQDIIDHFTTDTSIPVFMLSTKAGGAGINLACANKVIIFDSSFNPQDDIQAENRAHRVGQTREVEVVRLVTRGTIEVQIHALGESKLALDDRVAGAVGDDKGAEKKVEAEGERLVQDMFFKHLQEEKEGFVKDEMEETMKEEKDGVKKEEKEDVKKEDKVKEEDVKTEEKSGDVDDGEKKDLKEQFQHGLKDAGLNIKDE